MSIYGGAPSQDEMSNAVHKSSVGDSLEAMFPTPAAKGVVIVTLVSWIGLAFSLGSTPDCAPTPPAPANPELLVPQQLACQLQSLVPSQCAECFAPGGMQAECHPETCHADGHWVEVSEVEDMSMCDCQAHCIGFPGATAFQFNDDGWCGCLQLDGTTFDQAVASGEHIDNVATECALCNVEHIIGWQDPYSCHEDGVAPPICQQNTCHNDGHWLEVDFPHAESICECAAGCIAHPTATAFQFNADGFCGCLEILDGSNFNDAINGPFIHSENIACTLCTIAHITTASSSCPDGQIPTSCQPATGSGR